MITLADVEERQRRVLYDARPIDRREHRDLWTAADFAGVTREQMLADFWGAEVPGSGAYDEMLTGAVVAASQLGWDVTEGCGALERGWRAIAAGVGRAERSALADEVFAALERGRVSTGSGRRLLAGRDRATMFALLPGVEQRVLAGWQGQIAGGAFGTAIEGCTGAAISSVYGSITGYVAPPSSLNDDVVYELIALDVLAKHGPSATQGHYASAWSARIPFGWSAEWVALDNLARGVDPAMAGEQRNPMNEWIGAQMRGMVFGQLCPGDPARAAALARTEASVSHRGQGIEGAAFAAMLSALAFSFDDGRTVVEYATDSLAASTYSDAVSWVLRTCRAASSFADAWPLIFERYDQCNWIHAVPNIGAVISAIWFGANDMTESFALLARAGLDVDCNAGLVGTVLGTCNAHVPSAWVDPLGDRLETYLPSAPKVAISNLAEQTLAVSGRLVQ